MIWRIIILFSDDLGLLLRSPVIQKTFQPKSALSAPIWALVNATTNCACIQDQKQEERAGEYAVVGNVYSSG